jgi:hypothetical protein
MGQRFFDQYSLLHLAVGVITYFWNISLMTGFIIHFIFEIVENTNMGMYLINKYIIYPGYFSWPGGKYDADSITNIIGDNFFFVIGWLIAYGLDLYGIKNNWYIK